jgi:flagellar biosynthetic protein FliQ
MDDLTLAMELGREAIAVAAKLALPLLLVVLVVGAVSALLQSATQVQDPALGFVPKVVAVAVAAFALLPWMLGVLSNYAAGLIGRMGAGF